MKAINIIWDVDYEEDRASLPTEIVIPKGMVDEDEISDYISDTTGFCHKGFILTEFDSMEDAYLEILYDKVTAELGDFKKNNLTKRPEDIYDNWYVIGFYEEYAGLICDSDVVADDAEMVKWLLSKENILEYIHNEWLYTSECAFSHDWDDMYGFLFEMMNKDSEFSQHDTDLAIKALEESLRK